MMTPGSVGSRELSTDSRWSRLSQRSTSKRVVSSDDRALLHMEETRRELSEQRRRNEQSCHEAISNPDSSAAPCRSRSTDITIPHEFNLSASRTPRDSPGVVENALPDSWSHSLRVPMTPSRDEQWWTTLTTVEAPVLQTESRTPLRIGGPAPKSLLRSPQSASRPRLASACAEGTLKESLQWSSPPPSASYQQENASPNTTTTTITSLPNTNAKRQITRQQVHLMWSSADGGLSTPTPDHRAAGLDQDDNGVAQVLLPSPPPAERSAEERAQEARSLAKIKNDDKVREKVGPVEKFLIFKPQSSPPSSKTAQQSSSRGLRPR